MMARLKNSSTGSSGNVYCPELVVENEKGNTAIAGHGRLSVNQVPGVVGQGVDPGDRERCFPEKPVKKVWAAWVGRTHRGRSKNQRRRTTWRCLPCWRSPPEM